MRGSWILPESHIGRIFLSLLLLGSLKQASFANISTTALRNGTTNFIEPTTLYVAQTPTAAFSSVHLTNTLNFSISFIHNAQNSTSSTHFEKISETVTQTITIVHNKSSTKSLIQTTSLPSSIASTPSLSSSHGTPYIEPQKSPSYFSIHSKILTYYPSTKSIHSQILSSSLPSYLNHTQTSGYYLSTYSVQPQNSIYLSTISIHSRTSSFSPFDFIYPQTSSSSSTSNQSVHSQISSSHFFIHPIHSHMSSSYSSKQSIHTQISSSYSSKQSIHPQISSSHFFIHPIHSQISSYSSKQSIHTQISSSYSSKQSIHPQISPSYLSKQPIHSKMWSSHSSKQSVHSQMSSSYPSPKSFHPTPSTSHASLNVKSSSIKKVIQGPTKTFVGEIRITNLNFSSELENKTSSLFLRTVLLVTNAIDLVMAAQSYYLKSEVMSFREGSVISNFEILMAAGSSNDPNIVLDPLKSAVMSGRFGNLTVDSTYFIGWKKKRPPSRETLVSGQLAGVALVVFIFVALILIICLGKFADEPLFQERDIFSLEMSMRNIMDDRDNKGKQEDEWKFDPLFAWSNPRSFDSKL